MYYTIEKQNRRIIGNYFQELFMLIGLLAPQAMQTIRLLQTAYPTESVGNFAGGEFLCSREGSLVTELDGSTPTRLSFLDHMGNGMIGEGTASLTAAQFADALIAQLDRVKEHHGDEVVDKITDIDLLGCDSGVRWTDKSGVKHESIAETVSNRLAEAGYGNITVHTLTPEYTADNTVTSTVLETSEQGQSFQLYGFTDEGKAALNESQKKIEFILGKYQQFRMEIHRATADQQRLMAIPDRTADEDIKLEICTNWLNIARDSNSKYGVLIRQTEAGRDAVIAQYGKPPGGAIGPGLDLRQDVLSDPRNVIQPKRKEILADVQQETLRGHKAASDDLVAVLLKAVENEFQGSSVLDAFKRDVAKAQAPMMHGELTALEVGAYVVRLNAVVEKYKPIFEVVPLATQCKAAVSLCSDRIRDYFSSDAAELVSAGPSGSKSIRFEQAEVEGSMMQPRAGS